VTSATTIALAYRPRARLAPTPRCRHSSERSATRRRSTTPRSCMMLEGGDAGRRTLHSAGFCHGFRPETREMVRVFRAVHLGPGHPDKDRAGRTAPRRWGRVSRFQGAYANGEGSPACPQTSRSLLTKTECVWEPVGQTSANEPRCSSRRGVRDHAVTPCSSVRRILPLARAAPPRPRVDYWPRVASSSWRAQRDSAARCLVGSFHVYTSLLLTARWTSASRRDHFQSASRIYERAVGVYMGLVDGGYCVTSPPGPETSCAAERPFGACITDDRHASELS